MNQESIKKDGKGKEIGERSGGPRRVEREQETGARWGMGCKEGVRALVRVFKGHGKEREQESLEGVGTGEA